MVTRVDKKPIIHNTAFFRILRPSVVAGNIKVTRELLKKIKGHHVPEFNAREILDDYEDVNFGLKMFGIDDPYINLAYDIPIGEEDESIRVARTYQSRDVSMRQTVRNECLMEVVAKVQKDLFAQAKVVYSGTEAVYQLFNRCLAGNIFSHSQTPNYAKWATDTAREVMLFQANGIFIHPVTMNTMVNEMARDTSYVVWEAWNMYKQTETVALRISSRKSFLAHSYHAGRLRKYFEPSERLADDFKLPLTGYAGVKDNVSAYILMGVKYYVIDDVICALTSDDCVNLATMSQCYFRAVSYFNPSNGYKANDGRKVRSLISDMVDHCCARIDAGQNFSDFIRAFHILAQKEFNDAFEEQHGGDYGWEVRSRNYDKESDALDKVARVYYTRAMSLALNTMDRLNTGFIYHVLVGDEMLVSDLRSKVKNMCDKVLDADAQEWANFVKFCKSYLLCRFMFVFRRKPKVAGNVKLLNDRWATQCVAGNFRMPPASDFGKVWISEEFRYTEFADTWHLECQDVAYVMKDSKGVVEGKYSSDKILHSELLMAMKYGEVLNPLDGSTARTARDRIIAGKGCRETVLTCAPKAENAKPSWKKRVTFAADCEFRKMQAEVDRNCRRVMSFVRGPSLGVDQCILEKQFSDIAKNTTAIGGGVICSHDISAWSESMDRERKFQFEQVLLDMFDRPNMSNIALDWQVINAVVTKQGCKDCIPIPNGSFQGFDGSSSTLLHSMILIYCIETARDKGVISREVKTNMATLIDDCVALMTDLTRSEPARAFWDHLKCMYRKLGFVIDDLKSIFSDIKAIYLSRRFVLGGEVPADLKIFVKAHSSYEDPLRNSVDVVTDIFGGMRGAADANGDAWYIYYATCVSVLAEIAHNNNIVMDLPPAAAAIFALCPTTDNGWGFPSIISWATNDVVDKVGHFNALLERNAVHMCQGEEFTMNVNVMSKVALKAISAIKNQAWRSVSYSSIFTSPFETMRDGPIMPSMIKRNSVQDILSEFATAAPWSSLLGWNRNKTTEKVREILIQSGPLHAPTLAAMVHCMPDNYRLSLIGKAIGSNSVFDMLKPAERMILKRRVHRAAANVFAYSVSVYKSLNTNMEVADYAAMTYIERTRAEREEFFVCNGVVMTDHTFPDPVLSFTFTGSKSGAEISPNNSDHRMFDPSVRNATKASHYLANHGIYVPRRSGRVWEVTCEHAKGWDTVSQRIAMGLAILARAKADGHGVDGLLSYFTKAWNEMSTITPETTNLISIHGSMKRLDANPGSASHPIIVHRNLLRGYHNTLEAALNVIAQQCKNDTGSAAHLHDLLAHETSMLAVTCLIHTIMMKCGADDHMLRYNVCLRKGCAVGESDLRMRTDEAKDRIDIEIMDGEDHYGLLQACPALVQDIAVPTMCSSWVKMINCLISRDMPGIEELRIKLRDKPLAEVINELEEMQVSYRPSVILAAPPAARHHAARPAPGRMTMIAQPMGARSMGDSYTKSVKPLTSKFARELTESRSAEVITAVRIRSLIWDRFKGDDMNSLAAVLYGDPDAPMTEVSRAATTNFWRAVASDALSRATSAPLSDLLMSALRQLGVAGFHMHHTNDVKVATQSLASYFGAHLRDVVYIISDRITQLAGRRAEDFDKRIFERIICNSPGVTDARLKQKHLNRLIETTRKAYEKRIKDITSGVIKHRGDMRAVDIDKEGRLDDLWARHNVYFCMRVYNKGELQSDYGKMGMRALSEAVRRGYINEGEKAEIAQQYEIKPASNSALETADRPDRSESKTEPEDFLALFEAVKIRVEVFNSGTGQCWNVSSCVMGSKIALANLEYDAGNVRDEIFAVSAAEFAPKVYKRIVTYNAETPMAARSEPPPVIEPDKGEYISPANLGRRMRGRPMRASTDIGIAAWKALYTLILHGVYTTRDLNAKLGISVTLPVTCSKLKEGYLSDLTDDTVYAAFPDLKADYTTAGVIFNEDWLERDEGDAYTTDELPSTSAAFLF